MATVFLPNKYKDRIEMLTANNPDYSGKPIFRTNMHLLIFAATIGHYIGEKQQLEKGQEIPQRIFENNNLEGIAYLLALQDKKQGDILRDENENECWNVIEEYSAKGMEEIDNWFIDKPGGDAVDTILNQIKTVALEICKNENDIETGDLNF